MKKLILVAAICGAFTAISAGVSMPAQARDVFSFSFNTGDVGLAYRDGYYDRHHEWHRWANDREAREFRHRYHARYRDSDHDGIPNSVDRHPYNPYRG